MKRILISILIYGLLTMDCGLIYSQDDYLEVKGDTRVDTLTFSGNVAWSFPDTPVKGEIFYNFQPAFKRPRYFDGSNWKDFMGVDRYVATLIVAASNSLDTSRADEGYVCDGTDDQETINKAINDLPASGGAVYLLEGTYNISGPINLDNVAPDDSAKTIIGAGRGTLLRAVSATDSVINASGVNSILLSQLMIDGNSNANSGISFSAVTYSNIDQVWVENMNGRGINLDPNANNNIISNNSILSNGVAGIDLRSSNNNIVSGNNVQGNSQDGIYTDNSQNNIFLGNIIQSNLNEGTDFNSLSNNNLISGNIIQSNSTAGVILDNSSNNTISANNIFSNQGIGIEIDTSSNNTIVGNNVQSNGNEGISLITASNNTVSGNIVRSNGGSSEFDGIKIENNSDNNIISSNRIFDASGSGNGINWSTSDCNDNYAVGNLIDGAGFTRPINDSGTKTQYTDKVKMTLERREISPGSATWTLDVATNPRSYVYLTPTVNITKLVFANGKSAGDLLILENGSATRTVTIKEADSPGKLNLEYNLDGVNRQPLGKYDTLKLIWNGSVAEGGTEKWLEMEYVDN